ncbi:MAG: hypothetical protein CR993_08010 [Rhodobacterales bacterium]|nr:MAG: hypothetical protein CR993_08010 [Rhodobacterales bacterium]
MKDERRNTPWHLWVIALFFMFLYAIGIYDYLMMRSDNEAYYAAQGFGAEVRRYFTDYPLPLLALWTTSVFSAPMAVILLMFRFRWAVDAAFVAFLSMLLLDAFTFAFRDRWHVFG